MRRLAPKKLRNIMILFLCTGSFGILGGLAANHLLITLMGVSQLCLGGLFGWFFFTREPESVGKYRRKRKR